MGSNFRPIGQERTLTHLWFIVTLSAKPTLKLSSVQWILILTLQGRHILEQVERFRIGQCLDILDRAAMYHVTHRKFGYLA